MDYTVEKIKDFKVIGFEKIISNATAYQDCPAFWGEIMSKYMKNSVPETAVEQAVFDNNIGEFGVCVCIDNDSFRYMIAGEYKGGTVPEGLTLFSFEDMEWIKFKTHGKIPEAIQNLNTEVFTKFMPNNAEFDFAIGASIEWYAKGDCQNPDYESGIWVPIKRK